MSAVLGCRIGRACPRTERRITVRSFYGNPDAIRAEIGRNPVGHPSLCFRAILSFCAKSEWFMYIFPLLVDFFHLISPIFLLNFS